MLIFSGTNNQFIKLCGPILSKALKLNLVKESNSHNFVKNIQLEFLEDFNKIIFKLKTLKFDLITTHAFSYCLCSFLDEIIMNLSHEHIHEWSKTSLLSSLHKETWGGENFYSIVNYIKKNKLKYIELIEFTYLLNCLGYKGKFYYKPNLINPLNDNFKIKEEIQSQKSNYRPLQNENDKIYVKIYKKIIVIFIGLSFCAMLTCAAYYNNEIKKYKKYYSKAIKEKIHECEEI